jgi:hypothetical protein
MLRPSKTSILGSTRAERRRNLRREQMRAVGQTAKSATLLGTGLVGLVFVLGLPWAVPILYVAGGYLALSLPLRWAAGQEAFTLATFGQFAAGLVVTVVGALRAQQKMDPVAPVRPEFARGMLYTGWAGAFVLAVCSLAR